MRRWERWLTWFSRVLAAVVALTLLMQLGTIIADFLIGWGPLLVLRIFGRAIAGCILAGFALTLPYWMLGFATYQERRQHQLAVQEQRARRDWYTRWRDWANGLFRVLHPPLHRQAQTLILLAPTITRESLQEYLRDVRRASYHEFAFWDAVLVCLGLEVPGDYRLPPHIVPGAQIALAAAIAGSFLLSTCVLALGLRWLAVRGWRKVARAQV